ncbi:sulfite reductase (NADPH) flavoprotein alpha-component [Curtobacterium sp. UNCCL20]|uniref:sulfite reductase subunit alpha n=1 Tax=Curtobacterium sp. UNCCL20 TaxID=1502773 RepID=UPI0008901AB6|nr:sulfite reductase subunit alpha [Curtobacterium sp. UNCCL20]SDQ60392.1 sulfite reductase (NADPH) flavoprotein alpha-component [Curtobacterium sp. UNCCL20]
MSLLPPTGSLIPVDAPFSAAQESWLAGFIAGIAAAGKKASGGAPTTTIDVLFGTQTGNAEFLADELVAGAKARGLGGRATALDAVTPEQLAAMSHVLVVTSTYGEGEMPDNAGLFWEAVQATTVPRLEGLQYAVLGLGDTSYDEFCQAGKLLDTRFEQLGATRIHDRVDCDVDFEDPAALWSAAVLDRLAAEAGASAPGVTGTPGATTGSGAAAGTTAAGGTGSHRASRPGSQWNKRNPYPSRLVENRLLSSPRSAKEIRHYEFDLGDSGIEYAAGDALAVVPVNDAVFVGELLEHVGANGGEELDGRPIAEVLRTDREIRTPSKDLIADLVQRAPSSELAAVVSRGDKHELDRWLWGRDVLDLLRDAGPAAPGLDELLPNLRPLQARQYSISSSPLAHPDRIHLTIASVRYGDPHRMYAGVASTFLADRVAPDGTVDVYLQPNASFGVPADPSAPMIMIGPGTGIAPFRGFLHERATAGATGRNWLFFGDQHRDTDFVYEDELTALQEQGVLNRLDLAFSRDQAEKVYVQTRMLERAPELYAWLEDGGHVYVCGDASRMAKDVEAALLSVIASQRGRGEDDAQAYLADMRRGKRYVRDVY